MRILIAEDEVCLGQLLSAQLQAWGYEPTLVHDGVTALEVLRATNAPRLALLDWMMPGLNGIEVCRQLRQEAGCACHYLILLTGQGGRQQMLEALEAGADEFLAKPVDDAELKARLGAGRRIVGLQQQLHEQASHDALTGLSNRASVLATLDRERNRAAREGQSLGVVLADLDHFKHINDTFGHLAGDEVLRQAARRMVAALRPYDTVGRYGGEEFLVVLPGCDPAAALGLAERLRERVAAEPVEVERGSIRVTLSLGVTAWEQVSDGDVVALLRAADAALYAAKSAGRNRAVLAVATSVPADSNSQTQI
jgi:diguanylate cyclase (GGDEF)-like protein